MHDNPDATEREQELAQTQRLEEEEDMGAPPSPDDEDTDEED